MPDRFLPSRVLGDFFERECDLDQAFELLVYLDVFINVRKFHAYKVSTSRSTMRISSCCNSCFSRSLSSDQNRRVACTSDVITR